MSRWFGAFDAFLLTSENEGTPVVAIEALAAGCPVVATDAGGTATVVRDGETGYLRPSATSIGWRPARTARGTTRRRAAMGRAGARTCETRFATEPMADAVDALYGRLLGRA